MTVSSVTDDALRARQKINSKRYPTRLKEGMYRRSIILSDKQLDGLLRLASPCKYLGGNGLSSPRMRTFIR